MEQDEQEQRQEQLIDIVTQLVYEKLSDLTDTDVCGLCMFWYNGKHHGSCQWKDKGEKVHHMIPACYLYTRETD